MTPLARALARRISSCGPMPLSDYMATCLLDPEHGYYTTRDPLGAAGDFTTAPEISQMFGEVLGLALAQSWVDQAAPARFVLAEPGPGRGTLMADMLRAAGRVPGFLAAARLHLVEASPALRAVQAAKLAAFQPHWHTGLSELPEAPLFLVANEFFDALPIRQFVRQHDCWAERQVGLSGGTLAFGLAPPLPLAALAARRADTREGDVVETCAPAEAAAAEIARRIAAHGGAAIFIDYGGWQSLGDTFQALRKHAPCNPLERPGEADLTAHVAFAPLAAAARAAGAAASALVPQGVLLERLGVTERARKLAQQLSGAALENHIAAHRRLTHPQEMGNLFKALAIHPLRAPPPAGFAPDQPKADHAHDA
ncbi:MAG: SAM-dependent methyltransferase [Phaeovulum sp.]|uniref:class I SAM-dependent methyltransferase n=1 Tax=Phaeovulum sp. TaxID=2934796 RepID=UPI00272FAE5B|nr:SAM-dependent methyltransferase [Phaeovulum sp.]MDP2063960.1 SAM-dependent methyltransferase [Phaeovulum sp.]